MEDFSKDIGFTRGNDWFRYRAAAIILDDGKVLMVGDDHGNYLYSLGGAVQLGETAEEACLREVFEETGARLEIERLAFIHENFFKGEERDFLNGRNCHELCFYFLMKPVSAEALSVLHSGSLNLSGNHEYLRWVPIADYRDYHAFPAFFAYELGGLELEESAVKHIVTHE